MTREEHLIWAKERALQYVRIGQLENAFASFASDMQKHEELRDHPCIELGSMLLFSRNLGTVEKMQDWIEGFR